MANKKVKKFNKVYIRSIVRNILKRNTIGFSKKKKRKGIRRKK